MSDQSHFRFVMGLLLLLPIATVALLIYSYVVLGELRFPGLLGFFAVFGPFMLAEGSIWAKRILFIITGLSGFILSTTGLFSTSDILNGVGNAQDFLVAVATIMFGSAFLFCAYSLGVSRRFDRIIADRRLNHEAEIEVKRRNLLIEMGQDPDSEWRPGFGPTHDRNVD